MMSCDPSVDDRGCTDGYAEHTRRVMYRSDACFSVASTQQDGSYIFRVVSVVHLKEVCKHLHHDARDCIDSVQYCSVTLIERSSPSHRIAMPGLVFS